MFVSVRACTVLQGSGVLAVGTRGGKVAMWRHALAGDAVSSALSWVPLPVRLQ